MSELNFKNYIPSRDKIEFTVGAATCATVTAANPPMAGLLCAGGSLYILGEKNFNGVMGAATGVFAVTVIYPIVLANPVSSFAVVVAISAYDHYDKIIDGLSSLMGSTENHDSVE